MITQIGISEWPESLNDQAAMLDLEPNELQKRAGILFSPSCDSLDGFLGSVFRITNNQLVGLMRYDNNPVPGTILVVEQGLYDPSKGVQQLDAILDALGVA